MGDLYCFVFSSKEYFMSDATRLRVGFIGLGRMGLGLACRILGAGHDLVVFNRSPDKATDLVKAGAVLAPSIAGACEGREIVITMVTDDAALREVVYGPGGIRESLTAGDIHLAMGTHAVAEIQNSMQPIRRGSRFSSLLLF